MVKELNMKFYYGASNVTENNGTQKSVGADKNAVDLVVCEGNKDEGEIVAEEDNSDDGNLTTREDDEEEEMGTKGKETMEDAEDGEEDDDAVVKGD
ncbi:hypothetical protein U1Q18_004953, partial [Sarracenia purpurea var. burkii]